ncbi:folate synthesis bifunctional protein, mitochondrial-like [Silene latifolia]|uniref:folate synthesis bifunctional protein, mitochondrial-like n=1 Tax=Silene latifolia TaxID=37657 RepID=UPI003D770784
MSNLIKLLKPSKSLINGVPKCIRASQLSFLHSVSDASIEVCSKEQEVLIGFGSNLGDRLNNMEQALQLMNKSGINVTRHGCLYETGPANTSNQPKFLNSAVRGFTKLGPHELLGVLKKIERDLGRAEKYGPRPMDLDILFYGSYRVSSDNLTIPHERMWARPFVMAPLIDVLGYNVENDTVALWHSLSHSLSRFSSGLFEEWDKLGGESLIGKDGMIRRVLPVGNRLWDWSCGTSIMGILNLAPDNFSDGGKFQSVENAITQVRQMIAEGADIIALGAQSTRPMATSISSEEELERLIPILDAVKDMVEEEGKFLSVDTFYSKVASEAVKKGAHIVNDVSGGQLDPEMCNVIAGLKVPYIAMHTRGDPTTMRNSENLNYDDVCERVGSELSSRVTGAESSGIPAWRIISDPGVGFSKNTKQNLEILMGLKRIRKEIGKSSLALANGPLLIGPSRKRFLAEICDRPVATERDPVTVAAITAGILGGANIVRVHNVRDCRDAVMLCDAMLEKTGPSPYVQSVRGILFKDVPQNMCLSNFLVNTMIQEERVRRHASQPDNHQRSRVQQLLAYRY